MPNIRSILIANRGEIACRIMRTASQMGIQTIAVYSDADANAVHVKQADQAIHIGPSPVNESYLVSAKIIAAAKRIGADAIHPGYGFLSENANFAKACDDAGIIFIGPSAEAIDLMGDKAKAKRRMIKADVPCVPGYQGVKQDDKTLIKEAKKIGLPVMVKAAAGGGGRGMRLVSKEESLPAAIKDARSEALNAFGSDVLIIEKAVQKPRHVEIQIFADNAGNTIHLGERDCSVQRRHQKVLEEAPCPVMTDDLRIAMGAAAVKAAKDIGYVGAGTVEFMLDSSQDFYFLEMNTRLQVEHPVTEFVTDLDLVELQIRIAQGEILPIAQKDVLLKGHAIEARLYAEDPVNGFLPATGQIDLFLVPDGDDIRVDCGIETGSEVSTYYDPMIAKIIAYGATREEARAKLVQALKDTAIFGLKTNRSFLIEALEKDAFIKGEATTAFIEESFAVHEIVDPEIDANVAAIAAVIQHETARERSLSKALSVNLELLGWASAASIPSPFQYGSNHVKVTTNGSSYDVDVDGKPMSLSILSRQDNTTILDVDGVRTQVFSIENGPHISMSSGTHSFDLSNALTVYSNTAETHGAGVIIAPMHGVVNEVLINQGETVIKGQRLAVLEAMKMQHEILADIDGKITSVNVIAGKQVVADSLMFAIE